MATQPGNPAPQSPKPLVHGGLKRSWLQWLAAVSEDIQPVLRETVLFLVLIACDALGLRLLSLLHTLLFNDKDNQFAFDQVFQLLQLISLVVISLHFVGGCIVEVWRNRQRVRRELSGARQHGNL